MPGVVHQYRLNVEAGPKVTYSDIIDYSCLNGWACGNIAATPHAISQWWWDLFHGRLVSQGTLLEMMANQPLSKGWSPGLKYGLGLMQQRIPVEADPYNQTYTIGHGGCDYGSIALLNGFNHVHNFSISFATNTVSGQNCTHEYREAYPRKIGELYDQTPYFDVSCYVMDAVIQALSPSSPPLNCSALGKKGSAARHRKPAGLSNYTCRWQ